MADYKEKTKIINGLLQFIVAGGFLATAVVAPNALLIFDKPLKKYFKQRDAKSRTKEYSELLRYMRRAGLINYQNNRYEHGIEITEKGKRRAIKADLDQIKISKPDKWDKKWRIILFDIPEIDKTARDYFSSKLKEIGFVQLQKSVWVHPFPCYEEISTICAQYGIEKYVTYLETVHISAQDKLKEKFSFTL